MILTNYIHDTTTVCYKRHLSRLHAKKLYGHNEQHFHLRNQTLRIDFCHNKHIVCDL